MRVELQNIHKHYGTIKANNGISASLRPGEIHGFLGENGAGKSTLMKIIAGFIQRTRGEILIDGTPVSYKTPAQAARLGIGMLYQDPLDFPMMSVLDNFMLGCGDEILRSKAKALTAFEKFKTNLSFSLHPDAPVSTLSLGERQQLEILRLMARGCQMLILDEPTTGLSETQKEILFNALRQLRSAGNIVVIVSHKLKEIEALCDRITILRHGVVTGFEEKPFQTDRMLKQMFGLLPDIVTSAWNYDRVGTNLMVLDQISFQHGPTRLKNCSVHIREGECIGLAGAAGSGQDFFLRVAAGVIQPTRGQVLFEDKVMTGKYQQDFQRLGIAFLPAGRLEEGLIPGLDINAHVFLNQKSKQWFIKQKQLFADGRAHIERFRIKGEPDTVVEALSGGNQQRLLLSLLPENSRMMLLEHPTRGLDQETLVWAWQHLEDLRRGKVTIVFSSVDLDEILMMADRVLVFFEGEIVLDAMTEAVDAKLLGMAISGK